MKKGAVLLIASITFMMASCSKKATVSNHSQNRDDLRQLSLELEQSKPAPKQENLTTKVLTASTNKAELNQNIEETAKRSNILPTATKTNAKDFKPELTSSSKTDSKKLKKFEKLKQTLANKSGLNQNIKIGIILILVGVLVSYFIGIVGGIVSLIGLIFLILGLLEIL